MATHVIKRYTNRKLYDTTDRRYVSLDAIAALLSQGHELQVVDRATGDDITAVTLSQILVDATRGGGSPAAVRNGGDAASGVGQEALLGMVRQSLSLRGLGQFAGSLAAGGLGRGAHTIERGAHTIGGGVDDAVGVGLRNLNIATIDDVRALERRIDDIAARVDGLIEAQNHNPGSAPAARTRRRS